LRDALHAVGISDTAKVTLEYHSITMQPPFLTAGMNRLDKCMAKAVLMKLITERGAYIS
jgi:hypothetical protein